MATTAKTVPTAKKPRVKKAKAETALTADLLRELLSYDPESGTFRWLVSRGPSRAGRETGTRRSSGYVEIHVCGSVYRAHRLAWLHTYGRWPERHIDHINGDRADNRICNLRECTIAENQQNKAFYKSNTSGHRGVTWHGPNRKWLAQISVGGRKRCLGYFTDKGDAAAAYHAAKAQLHTFAPVARGK